MVAHPPCTRLCNSGVRWLTKPPPGRTLAARGEAVRLVPTWDGPFDRTMAGKVLLPGPDARIMATTFDEWLADQARG